MKNILSFGIIAIASLLIGCTKHNPLVINSDWVFESLILNNQTLMEAENEYVLHFTNGSNFTIHWDVNICGGKVQFKRNDEIQFSEMYCTEACCDSDFADKASALLMEVDTYSLSGSNLILEGRDGIKVVLKKK